ncbi:hypothetical protein DP107_12725 [Haloglomus irregulare]|uniref:Uncharacterized protein n=1 Tax=Haloglomus irregulare TaxID=2234134 RepID=A0A554N7H1_9EURY|nr:hypothetical protein [Haloglomus irregulare]TSD13351.1 hypothetical protein DP107_12725 [Haloglomus irregulare]
MTDVPESLRRSFIESDASPDGKWWVNLPAGLSLGDQGDHHVVDAVCLTGREQELPEVYTAHPGTEYVNPEGQPEVTKADLFRTLRGRDTFAEETVRLVAFDPGGARVGTVGDLLAARELVRADWPDWEVEGLVYVSDEDRAHVTRAASDLDVRVVRVS